MIDPRRSEDPSSSRGERDALREFGKISAALCDAWNGSACAWAYEEVEDARSLTGGRWRHALEECRRDGGPVEWLARARTVLEYRQVEVRRGVLVTARSRAIDEGGLG